VSKYTEDRKTIKYLKFHTRINDRQGQRDKGFAKQLMEYEINLHKSFFASLCILGSKALLRQFCA